MKKNIVLIALLVLYSCKYDIDIAEKDVVTAHYLDTYAKIEYAHNNLENLEFDSLIMLLLENYKNDINLVSDIAYYLHNKHIYKYDSVLINRCEYIRSLPNNYIWDIYYQKTEIRQYSTGDTNTGFTELPNSICNVMKK